MNLHTTSLPLIPVTGIRSLVLVLLLISISACGTEEPGLEETEQGALEIGQVAVQSVEERTVAPANRMVELQGLRGQLSLRGDDNDTAVWTFTKTARARDSTRARNVLRDLTVEERGTEERYTFALEGGTPDQSRIDIDGTLPAATPLTVRRSSGAVDLHGLEGALDIEQTHGDVQLNAMRGAVRVRVDNGDIDATWAAVPTEGEVDLETQNGTLRITLPASAQAQLDVATEAGRIFSQGLAYAERRLQASEAGYQFEGQLGDGGPSIRARTTHGNIVLVARPDTANNGASDDTTATAPEDLADPDTLIEASNDTIDTDTLDADTLNTEAGDDEGGPSASEADSVYTDLDQDPAPEGGLAALTDAATYPDEAAANDVTGRVYVQAVVNSDGTVRSAELVRGIGYGCDEEALRVVRNATFDPARRNGEPVAARTTVWVQFSGE